jgi:hypothetical protein
LETGHNSEGSVGSMAAQECAAIASDLERLKVLINDAGDRLLASFNQVSAALPRMTGSDEQRRSLGGAVTAAVTALQFQDMATQLTQHAQRRLEVLEGCLKSLSHSADDPLLANTRMQPVRQTAMGAGSIDFF